MFKLRSIRARLISTYLLLIILPLGSLSHQLYALLEGRHSADRDFTTIIRLFEEATGVEVRL